MSGRVCVVGSFMMDLVAYAPRRPQPGETLVGTSFSQHLGGKGMNQAVAAARAGASVSMVGALGTDAYGDEFAAALAAHGIDATHVTRDGSAGTGVGLPLVDASGENSIVIVPRANLRLNADHIRAAADVIGAADVVLLQQELSIDVVLAAAEVAREAGAMVVLNPAPVVAGSERLRDCVDLLVPNQIEAAALVGRLDEKADPLELAFRLRSGWRLPGLVITLGPAGSLVVDDGGARTVAAPSVTPVDTVGAGDAFCGSLAAELAVGTKLTDAARYASTAAALSVTLRGAVAAMPARREVDEFANRHGWPEVDTAS